MQFIRAALFCIGILLLLYVAAMLYLLPDQKQRDEALKQKEFAPALSYVELQQAMLGRLPSSEEFEAWKLETGRENRGLFLQVSGSLSGEDCPFGDIPSGGFGLVVWRGEWYECYASWENRYSFEANRPKFAAFLLGYGLLGLLAVVGAIRLRKRAAGT